MVLSSGSRLGFGCLLVSLAAACGGAAPAPAAPGTSDKQQADCRFLSDRVSTIFVRIESITKDPDDAAKYHAIGDLLDKLGKDLDRPFATPELTALAKDYNEAAKATAAVAHDGASMLSDGASARKSLGTTEDIQPIMDSLIAHCRGQRNSDCLQIVEILRGAGKGKTAAELDRANAELTQLTVVTPGVDDDRKKLSAYFTRLSALASQVQRLSGDGSHVGERFARAAKQFSGLDTRAKQLCPK